MSDKEFIAIDANDTGKQLEQYILKEDLMGLSQFSLSITEAINEIRDIINNKNGFVYMAGGDNILAALPIENSESVFRAIKGMCFTKEIMFVAGIGDSAIDSYLALKYAKATKKSLIRCKNNDFSEIDIE